MKVLDKYLDQFFDEIDPKSFYRSIFPEGELEKKGEQKTGKYNALAVELLPVDPEKPKDQRENVRKYVITDDLEVLDDLIARDNFVIISPISYIGRSRESKNARFIYALAIDLDGVETEQNIVDLFYQVENDILPRPTYTVSSGLGLHLYYVFDKPLPCFNNITKQLSELKKALTKKIWNKNITVLYDKPQIQSLFQGFRMVGTITKDKSKKERAKAYITGDRVSIEYLNNYVEDKYQVKEYTYKSKLTLKEAAKKYPDWFEKRIINKQPKGSWTCKKDLYDWWLNRLKNEIAVGHRYYGVMCLSIYAKKSGIGRDQLEKDAFDLLDLMDKLTTSEENHFTRSDILAALEMYNDNYITFPIDSIASLTNIQIQKNKRNYQPQKWHLEDARSKKQNMKNRGQAFKNPEGRPSKKWIVERWQRLNPDGSKKECMEQTGLSRSTVFKYWQEI